LLLDDVHERWKRDRDLFVEVADSMGAQTLVEVAEGDQDRQNQQADKLLGAGVTALVIVAHDTDGAKAIVEKAKARNVRVISYDRLIRNADVDLYMGFDSTRIGEMQAQYLLNRAPKGNYLLIGGSPSDGNAKLLREGQMKVLEPAVKQRTIRIAGDGWAENWTAESAARITEQALDKTKNNLAAIVASNDVTAAGAISALEKRGLGGKVLVSGQDAELDAARRIVAGTQSMTVYKSLRTLTRLGARSAVLMATGRKVDSGGVVNNGLKDVPSMTFDPIVIDKENLDGILIADGFFKRDQVYGK
jgi:D-xylose transport system substrate-binding protein